MPAEAAGGASEEQLPRGTFAMLDSAAPTDASLPTSFTSCMHAHVRREEQERRSRLWVPTTHACVHGNDAHVLRACRCACTGLRASWSWRLAKNLHTRACM